MNRIKPRDRRNLFFHDGWWWVDIQIKKKRYREKAGATEAKARDYRDRLRVWGRDASFGMPVEKPEGAPLRFEEFADDYLALYAKRKRSCERDERSIAHLKGFFTGTLLKDIGAEAVARYRASRAGMSAGTVNRELACLRTMLYKAVEYGRLKAYPLPTKKLLEKEPEFKPRILELEEAQRLVEFADPAFLHDAIVIYLATGMRLRELLGLPRGDVDFRRRELMITASRAKNGKARTIPLGPQVLEILKARPGREYFFENPKTGRPIDSLDGAWATAKTKAGITGRLRMHDLRDTFATWRLRAGVDIRTVSELIGDSPEVTLKRYCHSDAKTKRAAIEDLPDLTSRSRQKVQTDGEAEAPTASESVN